MSNAHNEKYQVKRIERGWAGHFICSSKCLFRLNTLLEYKEIKIVISTVGLMLNKENSEILKERFSQIGYDRYYETMVFHSKVNDSKYHDIDANRQIYKFNSPCTIDKIDMENEANIMHENIVIEIKEKLLQGEPFPNDNY